MTGMYLSSLDVNATNTETDIVDQPLQQSEDSDSEVNSNEIIEENTEVELYIDNQTVYPGMDMSYGKGYIPKEEENQVEIVLPLLSRGEILNKEIWVSPNLGDTNNNPFVYKNYELRVTEMRMEEKDVYCVALTLELKQERTGGTFPITWNISGESVDGEKFVKSFVTYVNVKEQNVEESEPENVDVGILDQSSSENISQTTEISSESNTKKNKSPKLLHIGTSCNKEKILPGDNVTLVLQFQNKNIEEDIINVSLMMSNDEKDILILNDTSVWYYDSIKPDEIIEVSVRVLVPVGIDTDAFGLDYQANYENSEGTQLTEEGTVAVEIYKEPRVVAEITNPDSKVYVGDAIAIKGSFMNTGDGKAYNLTVSLDADGLRLQNTLFIGEIESRDSATSEGIIFVDGRKGKEKYGEIEGVFQISFNDEQGKEHKNEITFTTELQPPVLQLEDNKDKKKLSVQWWITIGILIEIILGCLVYMIIKVRKKNDKSMEV